MSKPKHAQFTTDDGNYKHRYRPQDGEGQKEKITNRDWDVLIVLTSARVDALELAVGDEYSDKVAAVDTPAGLDTTDWMRAIWSDPHEDWSDVTYVSGEPVWKADSSNFDLRNHVGEVIETSEGDVISDDDSAWSRYLSTTRPDAVTNIAQDEEPPLVVHYRQPYPPFVGDLRFGTVKSNHPIFDSGDETWTTSALPEKDHVTGEMYRAAYLDNLSEVWEQAKRFFEKEGLNVALTSDKGTLLTPPFTHGKQNDPRAETVPWLESQ